MLLAPLLIACTIEPPTPPGPDVEPVTPAEVEAAIASLFCQAAEPAEAPCTAAGGTVTLGDHTVALHATMEGFLVLPVQTIGMGSTKQQIPGEVQLSAKVTASVDGAPLITAVASEAGAHEDLLQARAQSIDATAQRWMVGTGIAVLDAVAASPDAAALGALGMSVTPRAIGDTALQGWAAYPILRGQGFDPKMASQLGPSVESMVAALGPYLADATPSERHAVQVKAKLGGGGAPGKCGVLPPVTMAPGETVSIIPLVGTVTVDGQNQGDLCALADAVHWPLPKGMAVLEWDQVVVVGPAGATGSPEPTEGRAPPP